LTTPSTPSAASQGRPSPPTLRVGCIGLGRLGWAIAANLIASGFTVAGYRRHNLEEFAKIGGRPAASPAALAADSDVIITCLPDGAALESVIVEPDGILARSRPRQIVLEVSTLDVADKERQRDRLAARGIAMLDCPMSGNPEFARSRKAVAFLSGDEMAMKRVRPVIDGFTDHCIALGPFGNGSRMKYLANMLVAVHCMAATEVFNAGARVGMTPQMIAEALNLGAAASRQLAIRAPVVAGGASGQQRGNANTTHGEFPTISEFLRGIGAAAPLYETARHYYEASLAAGFGALDTSMIYTAILRRESEPHIACPPVPRPALRRD
jgi:3-hydroxyisobutyrate dehydrogenase-like beta-hydroxyacid dehydrogenase